MKKKCTNGATNKKQRIFPRQMHFICSFYECNTWCNLYDYPRAQLYITASKRYICMYRTCARFYLCGGSQLHNKNRIELDGNVSSFRVHFWQMQQAQRVSQMGSFQQKEIAKLFIAQRVFVVPITTYRCSVYEKRMPE